MPILWRYLTSYFLKIVFFCIVAFVAILLTMQLDDIAHFAALGAPLDYIFLFTLYQIPYVLPLALPLSCLIASLILIQRLSNHHELTALRACGFGLKAIFAPIWLTAAFLSIANFWIVSELATHSHLQSHLLKSELRSINPLLLLNNKHLMRLKGYYFDALGDSKVGESASQVIFAIPNQHHERLHLMVAENLKASTQTFTGKNVTLITAMQGEEGDFDRLLIENMKDSLTQVSDFSDILQKKVTAIHNDYLQMPLLMARIKEQQKEFSEAEGEKNREKLKFMRLHLNRSYSEIAKRLSIALAVISFTLVGTAFGIHISRRRKYHFLYVVISLTTFYLVSFFVAKELDHLKELAITLYLFPHLVMISASMIAIRRVTIGVES